MLGTYLDASTSNGIYGMQYRIELYKNNRLDNLESLSVLVDMMENQKDYCVMRLSSFLSPPMCMIIEARCIYFCSFYFMC